MNKKILTGIIVLLGLFLAVYGFTNAPINNESQIRTIYRCDRHTKEALSTDKYCSDPASAPEANKQLTNPYIYSGIALGVVGGAYLAISRKHQK